MVLFSGNCVSAVYDNTYAVLSTIPYTRPQSWTLASRDAGSSLGGVGRAGPRHWASPSKKYGNDNNTDFCNRSLRRDADITIVARQTEKVTRKKVCVLWLLVLVGTWPTSDDRFRQSLKVYVCLKNK